MLTFFIWLRYMDSKKFMRQQNRMMLQNRMGRDGAGYVNDFIIQQNIMTALSIVADIIMYIVQTVPHIAVGISSTVVSAGAGGDVVMDVVMSILSLAMLAGDLLFLAADSASFVIHLSKGAVSINIFEQISKVNFENGIDGVKEQMEKILKPFEGNVEFFSSIMNISNSIFNLLTQLGDIVGDIVSLFIPDDSGIGSAVIGALFIGLRTAAFAGQVVSQNIYLSMQKIYDLIPDKLQAILQEPKKLEKFMREVVDIVILFIEPKENQVGGAIIPKVPIPFLDQDPIGFKDVNAFLNENFDFEIPNPKKVAEDIKSTVHKYTDIKEIARNADIPIPYEARMQLLSILKTNVRNNIPLAVECASIAMPLCFSCLYLVEFINRGGIPHKTTKEDEKQAQKNIDNIKKLVPSTSTPTMRRPPQSYLRQ